jgi:PAS domain S-box-containing protein
MRGRVERNVKVLILTLLIWLASADGLYPTVYGQTPPGRGDRYLHTAWTTENGLPQNSVNAIVQTRDGYLWLGTFGGLARFDGIRFTIFDTGNTPILKGTRILSLYEDRGGALWIGAEFGGLARYVDHQFTAWTVKDGLPDGKVNSICGDREGNLWVGTDGGLARFTAGRLTAITPADGFPLTSVIHIKEAQDGSIWFLSNAGLTRYYKGTFTRTWPVDDVYLTNTRSLDLGSDGSLWIAAARGVVRFHENAFTTIARYLTESAGESIDRVVKTYRDRQGNLSFLTTTGLAHHENGRVSPYARITWPSRLMDNILVVRAVIEDREGNLWIGTDGRGLHRMRKAQINAYAAEEGLTDASFLAITEDALGGILFSSDEKSPGPYRFYGGTISNLAWKFLEGNGPLNSLLQARDGSIWTGDYRQASVIRDGRIINRYVFLTDPRTGNPVSAIYEDREQNIWIGTATEGGSGGLHRISQGQLTSYRTGEGLVHNNVRRITQDSKGALWIGTSGGVSRLKDGKFVNYTTENGLTHNYVREIHETSDGTIWLGTYGGGLIRFRDGKLTPITTKDGLYDNVVSRILEDDRGNFWMSCNRGIYRASRKELDDFADGKIDSISCINYGVADGMKSSECNGGNQPAGWKASDGKLWFPTQKGVVAVDPSRFNTLAPQVAIESVVINNRPVPIGQKLEIPTGKGDLEIQYTGLVLSAPEKVQFKYRLEEHDTDWVKAGTRRVAYYTNLPPKNYRFHVIASNNDGVWKETAATLEFRLKPHFYQTLPFYGLCVLALLLAGLGSYRLRVRHLIHRTNELEAKVAERTAEVVAQSGELAQLNDQLRETNTRLEQTNAQLKEANTQLEQANEDMLSTLDQLRLGVAITNRYGVVTFLSEAAQRLLGKTAAEVVGSHWEQALPLSERDQAELRSLSRLPHNRRTKLPVRVETQKDRSYWMEIEVRDDPRDPETKLFLLYDVTDVYDLRRLLDDKAQFHGLVGQSLPMQLVYKQIQDLAGVDTTVLITGETGTGKELVARAIHYSSNRKSKPFVAINCAGLTESLLASQLFGHKRGAFTGAVADQVGLVEAGEGGTLFLDEIGDMPASVQTSLLRVLQEKEITRLGESRPRQVNVRVVAATHRDLSQAVAGGTFREDLFYRIRIAKIELPPLRERLDDLPLLVAWFMGQIRAAAGKPVQELSRDTMEALLGYRWPGNVRELRSAVESAIVRCRGQIIQTDDLPKEILQSGSDERDSLMQALQLAKGNRAEAARLLGISRATLYRRLAAVHNPLGESKESHSKASAAGQSGGRKPPSSG